MADETDDQKADAVAQPSGLSRNKMLVLVGAVVALLALSVALTTLVFSAINPEPMAAGSEEGPGPRQEAVVVADITALRAQVEQQADAITRLEGEIVALKDSSPFEQLRNLLANQEKGFQLFLAGMKTGMNDLAHMVRGSRTWLEHYEGRLDDIIVQSQTRAEALSREPKAVAAPGLKP